MNAPELDFTAAGTTSGNGFTMALTGSGGTPISGTVEGRFFGPTGKEVGGTFTATGSGITYLGAYGASR